MLAGNVVALLSPLIYIPILTYAFGVQDYDYKSMLLIRLGDDRDLAAAADLDLEDIPGASISAPVPDLEKEQEKLKRASVIAKSMTGFLTISLIILWPMPMFGTGYVFSKKFFTGWVVVGILWLFCSAFCVGLYPLWEGRGAMAHTFKSIWQDLTGKHPVTHGRRRSEINRDESPTDVQMEGKAGEVVTEKRTAPE